MALVKVIADNLLSGASLEKLEVGKKFDVSDEVAKRWEKAGLVEILKTEFEVATPSTDVPEEAKAEAEVDEVEAEAEVDTGTSRRNRNSRES